MKSLNKLFALICAWTALTIVAVPGPSLAADAPAASGKTEVTKADAPAAVTAPAAAAAAPAAAAPAASAAAAPP
jgi:hypothetical protein